VLKGLPRPNDSLALAQHNRSLALQKAGDYTRAADAAKQAWLLIDEARPSSPPALTILYNLAKLRLFDGDKTRARAILQHAMSIYDGARTRFAVLEQDHAGTFGIYRALVEFMLLDLRSGRDRAGRHGAGVWSSSFFTSGRFDATVAPKPAGSERSVSARKRRFSSSKVLKSGFERHRR
jgi:hypothetical protein